MRNDIMGRKCTDEENKFLGREIVVDEQKPGDEWYTEDEGYREPENFRPKKVKHLY